MSNKKLEDFFNLPPSDIDVYDEKEKEIVTETSPVFSAVSMSEKINYALPTVVGLESHESEMDDISDKATRSYLELIALGSNVPDMHAGKIYEVAAQFLKTSLDAKIAKTDKKLKMIELQLKKVRAEQIDLELGSAPSIGAAGVEFDRNDLIKYIVNSKITEKIDNSDK